MSTTYIRNPAELAQAKADLDHLRCDYMTTTYPQDAALKAAALEESIFIYNQALWCAVDYQACINEMVSKYIDASNEKDDLFVLLSHGIDSELHPHAGLLVQLTYFADDDDGGIKDDEYLFTALFPRIDRAKYQEITRFLRASGLEWELIGDTAGDDDVWYSNNPLSKRLENWKLLKSDARRVYTGANHD